jgi:hypothetical protein
VIWRSSSRRRLALPFLQGFVGQFPVADHQQVPAYEDRHAWRYNSQVLRAPIEASIGQHLRGIQH